MMKTATKVTTANQFVQIAWFDNALSPTVTPTMPVAAEIIYPNRKRMPVISRSAGPPTTWAMSAIVWQEGYSWLSFPMATALYAFTPCMMSRLIRPGTTPKA